MQQKINSIMVLGVEMIPQSEIGKVIGTSSQSTVSEWLARADITGVAIKKTKYYSVKAIRDYLRYGKTEVRAMIDLIKEIKILQSKLKKGEQKN